MRIGLVDKYGEIYTAVEINGGAMITDTIGLMETILSHNGCGEYPELSTKHTVDREHSNDIKKEFLDCAVGIVEDTGNLYEERLVIYNKHLSTGKNTLFNALDKQLEPAEFSKLFECDYEDYEETDVKYFDYLIKDAIPDRVSLLFKSKEDLMEAFRNLTFTGFLDTSKARAVINEYYELNVVEKHQKYVEAYLVQDKTTV